MSRQRWSGTSKPLNVSVVVSKDENSFESRVQGEHLQDNPAKLVNPTDDMPAKFEDFLKTAPMQTGGIDVNVIKESSRGVIALNENFQLDGSSKWPPPIIKLIQQRVRVIRLLGCNTGVSDAGWNAVTTLAAKLKVEVHGTKSMISDGHFDRIGLCRSGLPTLLCSSKQPRPKVNQRSWLAKYGTPAQLDLDKVGSGAGARIVPLAEFPGGFEALRWYRVPGVSPIATFTFGVEAAHQVFPVEVIPGGSILRVRTLDADLYSAVSDELAAQLAAFES